MKFCIFSFFIFPMYLRKQQESNTSALTLSNVSGIFHILIGGLILAMVTAFIDFLLKRKLRQIRRTKVNMRHRFILLQKFMFYQSTLCPVHKKDSIIALNLYLSLCPALCHSSCNC